MKVTLRKVTGENVRSLCQLEVDNNQREYVVSTAVAIAEACFSESSWFRAIYADEEAAGFAVIEIDSTTRHCLLWRLMIDAKYQKAGIGRQALKLIIEHVKTMPNDGNFYTSVVPGDFSPQGFYEKSGFELTGQYISEEAVMQLKL